MKASSLRRFKEARKAPNFVSALMVSYQGRQMRQKLQKSEKENYLPAGKGKDPPQLAPEEAVVQNLSRI